MSLQITEEQILATQLLEVGRKIEEVQANPEAFTIEYIDKLEVERIGLINEYFRRFHDDKVTHIDAMRFRVGKL